MQKADASACEERMLRQAKYGCLAKASLSPLEMNHLPSVKVINTQTWRLKIRELASKKQMLAYLLASLAKCMAMTLY